MIGTAKLLAVVAKHQAAPVDNAERADVAVMARFEPARVIVLLTIDGDILDAFPERPVREDVGGVGVGKN